MIASMGMHECNSFDEEDIDELEADLQHLDGPSLNCFQNLQEQSPIVAITSQGIIMSLLDQDSRNVKLVGRGSEASYRAFFYVLLLVGAEQRRNYPHLNTLIRQQFYKPNIFCNSDQGQANMATASQMLEKSLKYFQEIGEGMKLEDYIIQEPVFLDAGAIMLRNSIELQDSRSVFDQLVAKFNIDVSVVRHQNESECLQLGANKRYYIIRQGDYYFVMITETKQDLGQSKFDLESVRSGESGLLVIPENSQQSTPKFKNSEVKFRKKSHKNSFGGDFQIVQYRDLLHFQSQKLIKPKVLSEYYDADGIESCAENLIDSGPKAHTFQDIIDSPSVEVKIKSQMKGSTTLEPTHLSHQQRRKDRKISSSEIIEFKDFGSRLARHDSLPQASVQEKQEENSNKPYNSLVVTKQETLQPIRMRTSLIQHRELERIDERQSSQKQSTHVDLSSQPSDAQQSNLIQNQSQVKLKDRKYSYFTQQMASSKYRNQKKIETGNYVFNIPKNVHKNSEVIMPNEPEHDFIKRRFQENPLRFSQLGSPSEESGFDSAMLTQQRELRQRNMKISSSVYTYQIRFQPQNWFKKQVIYYLPNQQKEVHVFERSYPIPCSPVPMQNGINYRQYTVFEPNIVSTEQLPTQVRQSFGSFKSLLSQMQTKQPQPYYISPCNTSQTHTSPSYCNPYQLNQTSFLKNRIQSLTNLQLYNQTEQSDDSKSVIFPSSRSMKEISVKKQKSPVKISFNYISSKSTITSTPVKNADPPRWQPLNRPVQQQRSIHEPRLLNNESFYRDVNRPQTFNGFASPTMRRVLREPMR